MTIEFKTYGTAGAFLEERFYPLSELIEIVKVIEHSNKRAKKIVEEYVANYKEQEK